MARKNKEITELRIAIETIAAQVAVIRNAMPLTRLRIEQTRQRTGLYSLLSPALDELDSMYQATDEISKQVTTSLTKLME